MKPAKARDLFNHLQGVYQVSIPRGCDVQRFEKLSYFYWARRPSQTALKKRIKEIAQTRVRHGYRRIHSALSTTQRYTEGSENAKRRVVEVV